jgi:hypothetical protein
MNLDENVPVQAGKFRLLAIILIAVFCLAVGGVGGYWVGSRRQQPSPTDLQPSLPKETVNPNKFDLQSILKLVSFYDSKRTKKFLVHYITDKNKGHRGIYLADTTLDWQSAVKIIDTDFQDIGSSPFVSYGDYRNKKQYITIELAGTDTKNLAIADENGKVITKNVLETNSFKFKEQGLSSYLVSFDRWDSPDTFGAQASPYGSPSDPDRPQLKLLVDAKTGRIIGESSKLYTQSQDLSSKALPH